MAATLITAPTSPKLSGDPNFITIQTDLIDNTGNAYVDLGFADISNVQNQSFTLNWSSYSIIMLCRDVPDNSGDEFPSYLGGDGIVDYIASLEEIFLRNETIANDFDVIVASDHIRLKYKLLSQLTITVTDNDVANLTASIHDNTSDPAPANLHALVKVFDSNYNLLLSLHSPYDIETSQTVFDLRAAFNLKPHLPDTSSIQPALFGYLEGLASNAYLSYFFRYADKYGVPSLAEAMIKSGYYLAVHGASSGDTLDTFGNTVDIGYLCHNYHREDGAVFEKEVSEEQPDWVYILVKTSSINCYVSCKLYWSDGSESNKYIALVGDLDKNKIYYFPSGYTQLKLDDVSGPSGEQIIAYDFGVYAGEHADTVAEVKYLVDCACHPWNLYLLLSNGMGGCESVRLKGKLKKSYAVERDNFQVTKWQGWDVSDGEVSIINAQAVHVYEASTGWMGLYQVQHLRQLLLGDIWIIDTVNNRFVKMVIDTKSFEIEEDDQELYALTFTFKSSYLDTNYNNM